ncbi:hypothetical protein [Gulbenkiania mobilis]|uniref:Uncharacterized protein n=1 Tax=Gulbenkiania mobilis TaxID=397457 RepID=A0ABY2CYQ1_GULMO|nr:hypothetical protein EV669_102106 [Gulbenkiania mobilis]
MWALIAGVGIGVVLAVVAGRMIAGRRQPPGQRAAGRQDVRPTLAQTQTRPIGIMDHSTGEAYGRLLRASRGDRALAEQWIQAEQFRHPGLGREAAIEQVAARLQAQRKGPAGG